MPTVSRWLVIVAGLTVASFSAANPLTATSVAALYDRTNDRILIAADCLVKRGASALHGCKILEAPGCVVAIAGLYEVPAAGFHLRRIVRSACEQSGSLEDKAEAFLRIARAPYQNAVSRLRQERRGRAKQQPEDEEVQTIFAGMQEGHLAIFVRGLKTDEAGQVIAERKETSAPDYVHAGFFLGLNLRIRSYIAEHPSWEADDFVELASRFVNMEIAAHPRIAGPPISEIELDRNGDRLWLTPGACDRTKSEAD